ncbi:unnamed protein product [Pleuronectes platessa]|uniref:Uncharacterized protein n=1 Tax=Pleuronectes platessa TaxID=8262 RepID=A0A9N7U785_PLEPL|nr:unnamed protein product [Pleuronectes platessa]
MRHRLRLQQQSEPCFHGYSRGHLLTSDKASLLKSHCCTEEPVSFLCSGPTNSPDETFLAWNEPVEASFRNTHSSQSDISGSKRSQWIGGQHGLKCDPNMLHHPGSQGPSLPQKHVINNAPPTGLPIEL